MAVKFKYIGDGYLPGIPARDLTDEDIEALTPEQRKDVKAAAIYEAADDKKTGGQ
jgi:hypothetical protein